MRSTWAKPALIVATLLPLQACGSPEANAFAVSLASTLASQVAQQVLTSGPAAPPAPSSGGTGTTGNPGGTTGSSGGGSVGTAGTTTGGATGAGTGTTTGGATGAGTGGTTAGGTSGSTGGTSAGGGLQVPGANLPGNLGAVLGGGASGGAGATLAAGLPDGKPTAEEAQLLALLQNHRRSKGLPDIPTSPSMMIVAQAHAADLAAYPNDSDAGCNMHSWSSHGPWTALCYTSDHAQAKGMWRKPQELGTGYPGNGYEIAYGMWGGTPTPQDALDGWISSPGHHAVMINDGTWKDNTWQAVGAGMKGGYAVIWFGEERDPRR